MKTIYPGLFIVLAIFLAGCAAKPVMIEDIVGHWSSISITYPNDPVFADAKPDLTAGSATFRFGENNRFQFHWDDTHLAGDYRLSGRELILTGDDEETPTVCQIKLTNKRLVIIMEDGFVLEFKKDSGT